MLIKDEIFFENYMKIIRFKDISIFLFFICVSLVPLSWFKKNTLIAGGDHTLYLNPSILVEQSKYVWDGRLNMGRDNFTSCYAFPYGYFWYFLQRLNMNNILIEKMWFIFIWFIASFSIYKLTSYLTKPFKYSQIASIFAVLIYQFNPYKMIDVLDVPRHLTYMVLPLLIYLFVEGLESKKSSYIVYFALSTLLFSSAWVNPPMAVITLLSLFMYFIYLLIIDKKGRKENILYVGELMLFTGLINIWWIFSYGFLLNGSIGEIKRVVSPFSPLGACLYEVFRFMGLWAFRSGHYLMPYYPYYNIYYETPLVFLTYLIPLIALSSLLHFQKINKKIFFFFFLFLIGIFLTAGKSSPVGFLFYFLYKYLPGFWIFRNPYAKFTPLNILSISILFAITVISIFYFIDKRIASRSKNIICKIGCSTILIGSIFATSFPLLTGDSIWHYWNGSMRSSYVKIPKYWFEVGKWFSDNDSYSRILTTPKVGYGRQAYNWESGIAAGGEGISKYFLSNPYLIYQENLSTNSQKMINFIYDNFSDFKNKLYKVLPLLSVKYIVQKNDFDWRFGCWGTYPPVQMKKILSSQEGIFFIKSFGKLDLYKISDEYFLPHIYPSTIPTIVSGNIETLMLLMETRYLDNKPVLLFTEQIQKIENGKQEMGEEPISNSQFPIPSIVFKDSTPEDLVLELVENGKWKMGNGEWKIKETEGKGSYLKWQKKFRIERAGVYEIWMENGKWETGNGKWEVKVDGKKLALSSWLMADREKAHSKNRKYVKVGEVELGEGEHKIEAHSSLFIAHGKDEKIKLILVSKKEREKVEKEIWERINQPETELCYIFSKKNGEFWVP
mgnify:CR=1 FL=1